MAPGDRLLLYSDGLSDVQSPDGEFFEKERLAALVAAQGAAQSATQGAAPGELCWMIFDALADFQGEAAQFDDMALLVLGVE